MLADFPGAPGPSVLFDRQQGSALATAHLLEHGHRRIGFIAPPRDMPPAAPKYAGYKRALAQAGLGARAELIETAATPPSSQATAALCGCSPAPAHPPPS